MLIKDFCEKHNVSRRNVDYWTNLGLLHPDVNENGYRDYGERADTEIGYIFIASMMDRPEPLKSVVNDIHNYNGEKWRKCINDMQSKKAAINDQYDIAYNLALSKYSLVDQEED